VYLFRSGATSIYEGIRPGAILVVDSSATPVDGSIVVCIVDGEFKLRRLRRYPIPYLQHLDRPGTRDKLLSDDADSIKIRGVITHIVTDARTGEFDDSPVI